MSAIVIDGAERTITVERCEAFRSGISGGRRWTLYEIHARDHEGRGIAEHMRSFDWLDGTEHVTFEAFIENGVFSHYTLKRVKSAGTIRARRNTARAAVMGEPQREADQAVAAVVGHEPNDRPGLDARVEALEQQLTRVEQRLDLILDLINTKG